MKVVIWQDRNSRKWYYDPDTLHNEQMTQEELEWEVEFYNEGPRPRNAKIVEIPDLPDPNTLA